MNNDGGRQAYLPVGGGVRSRFPRLGKFASYLLTGPRTRVLLARAVLVAALGLASIQARADVQYVYEPTGRLVQVVAPDGSSAVYQYDAAGNILSITRLAAGQLAFTTTSTASGPAGSQIAIFGSGFSTIPSDDIVSVDGLEATVVSATGNQLVVDVPAGATTGSISVTVGSSTVTGTQPFSVTSGPSVSGISPALTNRGDTVTLSGENLAPEENGTLVTIGALGVQPTSISASQLTFPAQASGTITVSTLYGRATSAAELVTLPSSIPVGSVSSSAALTAGGPAETLTIGQASDYGVYSFDATQGQYLTLQIDALTTTPGNASVSYQVYSPTDVLITSGNISGSSSPIFLPQLAGSGTYAIVFASGSSTAVQLNANLQADSALTINGTSLAVAASAPGESKRFEFTATAGESLALALTNMSLSPNTPQTYLYPYVYAPNGAQVAAPNCYTTNPGDACNVTLYNVPQTGTYSVVVDSPATQQMSFNVVLTQAVSGTLTAGIPQNVSLSTPGGYGVYSFTASAGEAVAIALGSVQTTPTGQSVQVTLYGPSGSQVGSSSNGHLNQTGLSAGTYTVVAVPNYAATGSFQLALGSSQVLATNGSSISASASEPGQSIYFTFSGTAGQSLALALTNMSLSPSAPLTYLFPYVYAPNGNTVAAPNCYVTNPGDACNVTLYNLPQTGTYIVRVDSPLQQAMSFDILVAQALTGALTSGTPQVVTVSTPGQYGAYSFTATAGEDVALALGSVQTTPSGQSVQIIVYGPNGSQAGTSSNGRLNLTNLSAGTYTVVAVPNYAATGSFQLAFGSSQPLPANGTSVSASASEPGQSIYFTFSGTAGESLALALTNMSLSPSTPQTYLYPYVFAPNGSEVAAPNCYVTNPGDACNVTLYNLPQTGTYTVRVDPPATQAMSFNILVTQAITGTLTSGTPQSVSVPTAGQYGVFTFIATAGEAVAIATGSVQTTPSGQGLQLTLYSPSGAQVATSGNGRLNQTGLAAGTYTVVAVPNYAATGSFQLAFGASEALPTDGTNTSVAASEPGQSAYFTFSATAGQDLALVLTSMSLSPSTPQTYLYPYVFAPNGSEVAAPNCYITNPGDACNITLYNLPQTGTYTVRVDPPPTQAMSFNILVTQAITGTLTSGTPQSVSVPIAGQYGVFTFTATAGEAVAIATGSVQTTPSGQGLQLTLYGPSGSQVATSGNGRLNQTGLSAGAYTVVAVPNYAATGSFQLAFGASQALPTNGTSVGASASEPGQSAYFTFSATAGQDLALVLASMSLSPSTPQTYLYPYVFAPNGSMVAEPNCYITNPGDACNVTLYNLPQTGTYIVRVDPPSTQAMSFNTLITQAVTGTLTSGAPQNINLSTPGQYGVFTFTATAGENATVTVGSISTTPSGQEVEVIVYNAAGAQVANANTSTGTTLNLTNLVSGTYDVVLEPYYAATGAMQVTVN